ncbi:MAG: hypothetical protein ABH950_06605 [Candidatus Altiarchaeota archaeon]
MTNEFNPDGDKLLTLKEQGHESASHGLIHDNKLPILGDNEFEKRFVGSKEGFNSLEVEGFRAPYNNFLPERFHLIRKYHSFDSSSQDTRIYGSLDSYRMGCASLFPHMFEDFVELPITMPSDYLLKNTLKKKPGEVLDVWMDKLEFVRMNGGLVLMQTHPESYDIGDPDYLDSYIKVLKEIVSMSDCWITTASGLAEWWRKRDVDESVPRASVFFDGKRFRYQ